MAAGGASKWIFLLPTGPDTTCIGPCLSSRHWATLIFIIPENPVGNNTACHPKIRSDINFQEWLFVAPSNNCTRPSAFESCASFNPASGSPSWRPTENRTASGFSVSPSMADFFNASSTKISARGFAEYQNPVP